jgi:hypothetical protein
LLIRKNGWGKLFVCLMLSLFLGFGSFITPVMATGADEIPTVSVTEDESDYQVAVDPLLKADTSHNSIDQAVEEESQPEVSDLSSNTATNEIEDNIDEVSTDSSELIVPVVEDEISETVQEDGLDNEEVVGPALTSDTTDNNAAQDLEEESQPEVPDLIADAVNNEVEEDIDEVFADISELIAPTAAIETLGTMQEEEVDDQVYAAPVLTADTTKNIVGEPIEITFSDDEAWRKAITSIVVIRYSPKELTTEQYTISSGKITLNVGVFTVAGDYDVIVKADGYSDAVVSQVIEKFVEIKGDGVTNPTIFTVSELIAMKDVDARLYGCINTWPTKKLYLAEGVKLNTLLQKAGMTEEAKLIAFKSTDGFNKSLTREQLDAPRYYYPKLKENHEYFGYIPGSVEGAELVDIILATRDTEGTNPEYMSDREAPHLVLGQRTISEQTNELFVKYVGTITVSTDTPEKWESPVADTPSGTYNAGQKVVLSTSDMDGDSIHYTTDNTEPTGESLMYNWVKKRWWGSRADELSEINKPITLDRTTTLKAIAIGPGREDSDIAIYEYRITDGYPPTLMRDTSNVCVGEEIDITFPDDQQWVDAIVSIKVDGTEINREQYTLASNKITILSGVFTEEKDYTITVSATDFRDASVVQKIVLENLSAPTLVADITNNMVGQPIKITFIGNEDWQAAITNVFVNGTALDEDEYTIEFGTITIAAGVLSEARGYNIVVEAVGYDDATVQKTMNKIPPALESSIIDYGVSESIEITFTDDEDWRSAITKVSVGVVEVVYGEYSVEPGKITIPADILDEIRDYTITVQAGGYVDAIVTQTIWPGGDEPPVLAADTTDNSVDRPLQITFEDNARWRAAITKVSVDGTELADSKYKIESGMINISANVLPVGEHTIVINAAGYRNAVVTQPILEIPPVLTPQLVNNGVGAQIELSYPRNDDYRLAVEAVLVDGVALDEDQFYSSWGFVRINAGVLDEIKDYNIVVQAKGYLDATVIQPIKKAVPKLSTTYYGYIGKAIELTFNDDPAWRAALPVVYVDGEPLDPVNYTFEPGKLIIKLGVLNEVRNWSNPYLVVISANEYADASAKIQVRQATAPKLTPDTTNNTIGQLIELTFEDDPYWRSVVIAVKVDGVALSEDDYAFDVGKLTIQPHIFILRDFNLFDVRVEATGYSVSSISQSILIGEPPALTADETDNTVDQLIGLTFNDDAYWRSVITAVNVDGVELSSDDYAIDEGKLTINPGVFTEEKIYEVTVQATGYNDSSVSQTILAGEPPVLTPDETENSVGNPIELTFADNEIWRNAIMEVTINDVVLTNDEYTLDIGKLIIADSVFVEAGTYTIVVKATAYSDAVLQQLINEPEKPQYNVIPKEDASYTIGETEEGIKTMTVNADQSGFMHFTVSVETIKAHKGTETVVFTQYRDGSQIQLNASEGDFDEIKAAKAGFNVNPDDVIKVYIVDQITNDKEINPVVMQ